MNEIIERITKALETFLQDQFSKDLLRGSLRALNDRENKIRLAQFAAGIRELFSYFLHLKAPDDQLSKCIWFHLEPNINKPTRRQRAIYATQGGLSNEFLDELGLDHSEVHKEVLQAVDQLNKYTHIRPETLITDQTEIEKIAIKTLSALELLFGTIEDFHQEIESLLVDYVGQEVIHQFIENTFSDLDILSTHHYIESVDVDQVKVESIDSTEITFMVDGTVYIEQQYGSSGDVERGDGWINHDNYPFKCHVYSSTEEPRKLNSYHNLFKIDTSSFYE